jgi:hypothetical protein
MEELRSPEFREKVQEYIRANIRAQCPGLTSAEDAKSTPAAKCIAWRKALQPEKTPAYWSSLLEVEARTARAKQLHTCRPASCLRINKKGEVECKRHAPFVLSLQPFVHENGDWGPQRTYGYVNGWNPTICVLLGCNHDIKLLTNGQDSCRLTFYCSGYVAKDQFKYTNMSAILAKNYAFQHLDDERTIGLREACRLMLFRCLDAINREQELAAPLVMSYLMGWGDIYKSHNYVPVYWSPFEYLLVSAHPELRKQDTRR